MEKCNICIVVLVGLPAAGKTSFCSNFTESSNTGLVIKTFTYDKLCTDYSSVARKNTFKAIERAIKCYNKVGKRFVFIIDDNMYYKSMRRKYLKLARLLQTGFLQIYFDITVETALARNSKRIDGKVPDTIIKSMAEKLEVPKNNTIIINSEILSNKTFEKVIDPIYKSFNSPLNNSIHNITVSNSEPLVLNKLQNVDLYLRKLVNRKVSKNPHLAEMYNKIKSVVFRNVKKGCINVDLYDNEELYAFLGEFLDVY